MRMYGEPAEALEDGLRLAAGMTRKLAVLGLPCGGGKAVLAVPSVPTGDERRRVLERYAELVDSLGGTFVTGPDMNTGEADMDVIGARTPHVFCRSVGNGGSGDPSIHTALGVFHGIRATLAHAFGSDDPAGRTVLVQGAGSVGAKLAALLAEAGATVLVSDVDEERARATGAETVPPDSALETECDVYAPCALGATLNAALDSEAPLPRCRGRGEQPTRDRRGWRPTASAGNPLRTGLRDQRRRRAPRDRARAPRLGCGAARAGSRRDRHDARPDLRRSRRGGDPHPRGSRAPGRRTSAGTLNGRAA